MGKKQNDKQKNQAEESVEGSERSEISFTTDFADVSVNRQGNNFSLNFTPSTNQSNENQILVTAVTEIRSIPVVTTDFERIPLLTMGGTIIEGPYWTTALVSGTNIESVDATAVTVYDLEKMPKDIKDSFIGDGLKIKQYLTSHQHPNIVNIFSLTLQAKKYVMIHELTRTNLEKLLSQQHPDHPVVNEKLACLWGYQLASALDFIHSQGIAHRNLNPKTVWLSKDFKVCKLGNFSHSCLFFDGKTQKKIQVTPIRVQDSQYHSTDESQEKDYDVSQTDVWMWAATVVFMLTEKFPSQGYKVSQDKELKLLSKEGQKLLSKCLESSPSTRPTSSVIVRDKWFFKTLKLKATPVQVQLQNLK